MIELATGAINAGLFYSGSPGLRAGIGQAEEAARAWMRNLVTSTPLARPPYDPVSDPELMGTLRDLFANLQSGGAGTEGPSIEPSEISGIAASVRLSFPEGITQETAAGGVRMAAGAEVAAAIELAGSLADLRAAPRIGMVTIESSSVILMKDGAEQAAVKRFVLRPGGELAVEQVTALGEAGAVAGVESLIRLVGVLSTGRLGVATAADLESGGVEALAKTEVAAALSPAVRELLVAHRGALPGVDLGEVFGVA